LGLPLPIFFVKEDFEDDEEDDDAYSIVSYNVSNFGCALLIFREEEAVGDNDTF
jgi:hypothetical protein